MKNKITAKRARDLAGPTIEEEIDAVYARIKAAAENKERSVELYDWATEGYLNTEKYNALKKELTGSGFEVELCFGEREADTCVIVKW